MGGTSGGGAIVADHEDQGRRDDDGAQSAPGSPLSRRAMMGGAGVAVAAATVGSLARPAGASAPAASSGTGLTVAEFVARITQDGSDFTAFGYLTKLADISSADLFAGTPANEGSALFTAFATGKLVARAIDGAVHNLDIEGELSLFRRAAAGATYADPASFRVGSQFARFSLTLQDILTVIAPDTGLPTLTGDMRQLESQPLRNLGRSWSSPGRRLRFFATGLGNRSEATAPKASLTVAGNFTEA